MSPDPIVDHPRAGAENGRTYKCKECGGSGKIDCPVCKGRGKPICEICNGKRFVPAAWTATDNPWLNRQPDLIRLKDGRIFLGKVAVSSGEHRTIVTRDRKAIHVEASDIVANTK